MKPPLPAVPFDCAQPFSNELGVIAIPGSTANYRVSPRRADRSYGGAGGPGVRGPPRCVASAVPATASATARTASKIHTQTGVLLIDFFDEVLVRVTRCLVVCWTVVVVCSVVVVVTVIVVGTVVVTVVVGVVWAIPLAGANAAARTAPAAKSATNAELLSQRCACFLGTVSLFPSSHP